MSDPASFLYAASDVREMDRIAIAELGIPGYELMCRAGRAAFDLARERYPRAARWLVLCGAGNNAGDGYVIARLARAAGIAVDVAALSPPAEFRDDAARAWRDYAAAGGIVAPPSPAAIGQADLVFDAMLGTGLARALEGAWREAVEWVNAASAPVVAVDVPTGLDADTGAVHGVAIDADLTVTFIGRKQGLYVGHGPDQSGDVVLAPLGIEPAGVARVRPRLRIFDGTDRVRALPRRARTAHKGNFGHVLVIGGNEGMPGAARLCGEAALRAGAGLVSVATRPTSVATVASGRPELMCRGIVDAGELDPLLERATVIAIGPGLGQDAWSAGLLDRALASGVPVVVDADALNLLAAHPRRRDDWILTPHPGEASRLLGIGSAELQGDRVAGLRELTARFGGVVLLKGRCTLVGAAEHLPFVIDAGNPGMASGGMGDVLTGIVAGLVAQSPADGRLLATACAADVHARAGDDAARSGERGIVASDLFPHLRRWLNPSS